MKPKKIGLRAILIAQAEGPESGAEFLHNELTATRVRRGPGGRSITEPDALRRVRAGAAILALDELQRSKP